MYQEYLLVAQKAVDKAETVLKEYFHKSNLDTEIKQDGSPVTEADKAAERVIIETITAAFPGHNIYSEEVGDIVKDSEFTWIIDPIDGTKFFMRGMPFWGVLVALMKGDEVIVGVSSVPELNERMHATKGGGAFLNDSAVKSSRVTKMSESYIVSGTMSYFKKHGLLEKVALVREHCKQALAVSSCWQFHYLAQGKIDATIDAHVKIQDIAPFKLIIEEAGGVTSLIDNSPFNKELSSFVAAANETLHSEIKNYLD